MAEVPLVVASAVIMPELEEPPTPSLKRRRSSASENNSKRRRISLDEDPIKKESASIEATNGRPGDGQAAEERKRGRRLFGALLGTLSQSSSSSTAQKRRSVIEKKQQAKLKQQTEEADERKKEKLEALIKVRRKEQRSYDRRSTQIRHSNLLAQAHFLRTKTEPRLYYKPWKLAIGDEETIERQIKAVKETIEKESAQWEVDDSSIKEEPQEISPSTAVKNEADDVMATVGDETNKADRTGPDIPLVTNSHEHPVTDEKTKKEVPKDTNHPGADGEEMVEGEEDTVIY